MKWKLLLIPVLFVCAINIAFKETTKAEQYSSVYHSYHNSFSSSLQDLLQLIDKTDMSNRNDIAVLQENILKARRSLKAMDFWARYLEPLAYKRINGPLPVEWETEVFEKFEKPYKREGAGLTLAALYLEEESVSKDSVHNLIAAAIKANSIYNEDSITNQLQTFDHFYFCNRLYLLNLAAIYTTGFECPNTDVVIPELRAMMNSVSGIYTAYNEDYKSTALSAEYLALYQKATDFVVKQPDDFEKFDHFSFIKNYVNPLFSINQQLINQYRAMTKSTMDFALNKEAKSIFSKSLYTGQNVKGVYFNVVDEDALASISRLGKMLFFDPILSGNNERSCASCHKHTQFFTDTVLTTSLAFDHAGMLPRNTPSLINVPYNHLIMYDGKHISLQDQTKGVMFNPIEMNASENEILEKILSCPDYRKELQHLLKFTPSEPVITIDHVSSALTFYYSKFSSASSAMDKAINDNKPMSASAMAGFNLFMSKAQCATCHFVPQFNGVKPPYVGSEFEVLGTPANKDFKMLSADKGRYEINPAKETMNAFRTGNLRNVMNTAPYMHNGVFRTMEEVIDFYDAGGGAGRGLNVPNQTLSSDSLHLSGTEKANLIAFLKALTEDVPFEEAPKKIPLSANKELNKRLIGGSY
jgi:cytochrome c peroxidase